MSSRTTALPWLWLSALIFVLDQATKLYFDSSLRMYEQIEIIPGLFSWTLAYNTGAAFSFLADHDGWQRWFFAAIALGAVVALTLWLRSLPRRGQGWLAFGLAMVLGGAVGNLFDRVVYGHVIDFILVHWQDRWYFPAFNVADCGISIGAALLVLDMFKSDSDGAKQ